VFATTRFGVHEIAIMQADGSAISRLERPTPGTHPVWLPDGERILYSSAFEVDREGLVVVRLDGSGAVRVTRNAGDGPASWRP